MPVYNEFKTQLMRKIFDLEADDIVCNLFNNDLVFNPDETGYPPAVGTEVSSANYPNPDSNQLQGKSVTQDNANDRGVFDAQDITWSDVTFSPRWFVLYDDTPVSPPDPFIAAFDFGSDQNVTNGNFTIQWDDPNGIININ